ncbi:SDR family NAD(P)-dependent oxidoreductase [Microbacterium sp. CIAB417]|uniref:SDR family NAD(P)-dependent oxidoreductase n=1 Tax=Microbacterium sp. CIAB417 TaxID=2860287 RepID=UPI001FAD470E|nr:SDR family oxidoreductase [Microbacterium sp. CIAB417]
MSVAVQLPARILVTGASGQIGGAVVDRLVADGTRITAVVRNERSRESVADRYGDAVDVHVADLDTEDGLARAERLAAESDALALCSGTTGPRIPVWEIAPEDWDRMAATNVRPVIRLVCAAVSAWIARSHPGAIVTLSSPGVPRAHRYRSVYDASRAAVESFTRATAVDVGEHGIRVNGVRPAAVGIDAEDTPLRRGVRALEVADGIRFLLSSESSAITGHHLDVDAGLLAALRSPAADRAGSESNG